MADKIWVTSLTEETITVQEAGSNRHRQNKNPATRGKHGLTTRNSARCLGGARQNHIVAVAAVVGDLECHAADDERRSFGQSGKRAAYSVGAIVVDDGETVADQRRETKRHVERAAAETHRADGIHLVKRAGSGAV